MSAPPPTSASAGPGPMGGPSSGGAGASAGDAASGAGPAGSRKRKVPPSGGSNVAAVAKQIRAIAAHHKGGVRQKDLETQMSSTPQPVVLAALNQLMASGALIPGKQASGALVFKLQSEEDAAKLNGLTAEDRLVLQEIEKAGASAISTKELRFRAGGLPQASLNKVLKKLESRSLVKPVKSVNAGNVKKYMIFGLAPSKEVTGGPWYHDGEFDYALINALQDAAVRFLQREQQASAADVHAFIRDSGMIKGLTLRQEDVDTVLEALVYDARLEMTEPTLYGEGKQYRILPRLTSIESLISSYTCIPACQCLTCQGVTQPRGRYIPCPNLTTWLDGASTLSGRPGSGRR